MEIPPAAITHTWACERKGERGQLVIVLTAINPDQVEFSIRERCGICHGGLIYDRGTLWRSSWIRSLKNLSTRWLATWDHRMRDLEEAESPAS
uniref:Uncharacterized protein n=1 Tax=uncultured prokaryote TaxID=198431 RepID=A0A0H5Q6N0_9ZZZZ|nr:hypothetical protein [uncultured prokaryote]